jgi:hypothetical protein
MLPIGNICTGGVQMLPIGNICTGGVQILPIGNIPIQISSFHFNWYLSHCGLNSTGAKYEARTKTNVTQKQ